MVGVGSVYIFYLFFCYREVDLKIFKVGVGLGLIARLSF